MTDKKLFDGELDSVSGGKVNMTVVTNMLGFIQSIYGELCANDTRFSKKSKNDKYQAVIALLIERYPEYSVYMDEIKYAIEKLI